MAILPLLPTIQHYAWGGKQFIPDLLDMKDCQPDLPYAELWMGAHPKSPSRVSIKPQPILLSEWIKDHPIKSLGEETSRGFNSQLPFLFKILDVKKMLSIQVHPSKNAAEHGFAKENKMGIPLDAAHRNYRDANHKPEIMLALTDFWLLHGFMPEEKILQSLINTPEFESLAAIFRKEKNIGRLYKYIMQMPQEEVNDLLSPLKKRLFDSSNLNKNQADYWAKSAFIDYTNDNNYDRGIFSIYIFNLLKLKKGDVIFQGSGMPHAYLEGVNVELMANSDNVFRGGLTPKHIDIEELLEHTKCQTTIPEIIQPEIIKNHWKIYKSPAPDFELSEISVTKSDEVNIPQGTGPAIYLVFEGTIAVNGYPFQKGDNFWVDSETTITIQGNSVIYRAGMPF